MRVNGHTHARTHPHILALTVCVCQCVCARAVNKPSQCFSRGSIAYEPTLQFYGFSASLREGYAYSFARPAQLIDENCGKKSQSTLILIIIRQARPRQPCLLPVRGEYEEGCGGTHVRSRLPRVSRVGGQKFTE